MKGKSVLKNPLIFSKGQIPFLIKWDNMLLHPTMTLSKENFVSYRLELLGSDAKSIEKNLQACGLIMPKGLARAAKVNFDWRNAGEVIEILKGEIIELEEAIINNDAAHSEEEFGDILFTCVNLARHLKTSVEQSLHQANEKFSQRFKVVEQLLAEKNMSFADLSFDEMLTYWQKAKIQLKEGKENAFR